VALNSLGASPFLLSLMATSASIPSFLFTLRAGVISDLANRQNLFTMIYRWLAAAAGLLAVCSWLHVVHPYVIISARRRLGGHNLGHIGIGTLDSKPTGDASLGPGGG